MYKIIKQIVKDNKLFGAILADYEKKTLHVFNVRELTILGTRGKIEKSKANRDNKFSADIINERIPQVRLVDLAVELENIVYGKGARRKGNADKARAYANKHKLLDTGLELEIQDDEHIYLLKAPKSGRVFEIPEFITGFRVRGKREVAGIESIRGPFKGSQFSEIRVKANLPDLDYLFCGIESDSLEVKFNNNYAYSMDGVFCNSYSLTKIKVTGLNTSNVTNMRNLFNSCESLQSIDIENFNTGKVELTDHMFNSCKSLTEIDVSSFNLEHNGSMVCMFSGCNSLEHIKFGDKFICGVLESMAYAFAECTSLTEIQLRGDTSSLIDMSCAFDSCESLKSVDLSECKLDSMSDTTNMFYNCTELRTINFGENSLRELRYTDGMFRNCCKLVNLNLEKMEAPDLSNSDGMFRGCESIGIIRLPNLKAVICINDSEEMFAFCGNIKELDLGDVEISDSYDEDNPYRCPLFNGTHIKNIKGHSSVLARYNFEKENRILR